MTHLFTPKTLSVVQDLAELVQPSVEITVPEAAEKHLRTHEGDFSREIVPYMNEPGECLTSRMYDSVIFVGPSRTGKTMMLADCWLAYTVIYDPDAMLMVFPVKDLAKIFSERRIDRIHRHSPDISSRQLPNASADNIFEKKYRNGMIVYLVSPTKNTLASIDVPFVLLSDYDRYPDDIGGEGNAFALGSNRTLTFGSRGMTAAESSPSRPIINPKWKASKATPHMAPPCGGILSLYNGGDRRRIYGQCQSCGEYWCPEADITSAFIPDRDQFPEKAERLARWGLVCPICGVINNRELEDDRRRTDSDYNLERAFKSSGTWVREGQSIDSQGRVTGHGIDSKRASFWLTGWFAKYRSHRALVDSYIEADDEYERTGDEGELKSWTNTKAGGPYLERDRRTDRSVEELLERKDPQFQKRIVPDWVRFIIGTVDVQKTRWSVQFEGFGEGLQAVIIDRFEIQMSERTDDDGQLLAVQPESYPEDWGLVTSKVVDRTFALADGSGRRMKPKAIICDLHGLPGVTPNAFEWWRGLKRRGKSRTVRLARGGNSVTAKRVDEGYPDQTNKPDAKRDKRKGMGDVPMLTLNVTRLKSMVFSAIDRTEPGDRYVHLPEWLPEGWFAELLAETMTSKGIYEKIQPGAPNETLDHMAYARAATIWAGAERINWDNPPSWAQDHDRNTLVFTPEIAARGSDETPSAKPKRSSGLDSFFNSAGGNAGDDGDPWLN